MKKNKLIVIGAGGYSKSVLDSINYDEYDFVGFIDERIEKKEHIGYPILSNTIDGIEEIEEYVFFIAIGDNYHRKIWFDRLNEKHLHIITIIDKSAIVSNKAEIGYGCFVGKMAVVNSHSKVGENCIINTRALVEHGCVVGKNVNLSTNSTINGDVIVGENTVLYSGVTVIGQTKVGKNVVVGAGAIVVNDIPDNVLAVGIPAKIIKENIHE